MNLDSDLLRTFLAIEGAGSITGGAARIGRSQSATSLQVRQLEEIVGQRLFRRHGRGVLLTAAGEALKPTARLVVRSLDNALGELRGGVLRGKLRIGVPDDHSRAALADIVSQFAIRHPDVELEVHCALGTGFAPALASGVLDLAVFEVPGPEPGDEVLRKDRLIWMQSRDRQIDSDDVLPVAVFDRDCWWRDLAVDGLEKAGRSYRVVFTSESTIGVRAAVRAGIAVGLLNATEDLEGLKPIAEIKTGYPTCLILRHGHDTSDPVCEAMCDAIRAAFKENGATAAG